MYVYKHNVNATLYKYLLHELAVTVFTIPHKQNKNIFIISQMVHSLK